MSARKSGFWCAEEFSSADFGDTRLKVRFIKTAEQLARQPERPINQACTDWADTKAAYRLFANEKVQAPEISASHQQKTLERMQGQPLVLAVQDTTYFNYTGHEKTLGLGHIGTSRSAHLQGLIMHSVYTLTPDGVPLGLLHQNVWARKQEPKKGQKRSRDIPLEQKESYAWVDALETSLAFVEDKSKILTVADRGADIYEFMAYAAQLGAPFLIRAAKDRAVLSPDSDEGDEFFYLWDHLSQQPIAGQMSVEVPARSPKEPARTARVSIRFAEQVQLRRPRNIRLSQSRIELPLLIPINVIFVQEMGSSQGIPPLEWMLLCTLPVQTLEQAIEKINWYKLRWRIEIWHKILKSGCQVEKCRLESADRLTKYLALFSVIAWRLHWLTHANRQTPELPCTHALSDSEWKALYCKIHKSRELPKSPPTLRQATRWIAQLGGFLGRKHDGEPGVITLWRGWQRLMDITDAFDLFSS